MEPSQNPPSGQSAEERVDLQELLNPKPKISSLSTFAHLFWIRRWIILGVWLVLGVPAALFLAFYDIPRTYWATSYIRFPNVVGDDDNMAHDAALVETGSILTLFKSYNVMSRTIQDEKLQFQIQTKDVFRRNVFEDIQYQEDAPVGHYTFIFQSYRRLEVDFLSPRTQQNAVIYRGVVPEDGVVSLPSMTLQINRRLLSIEGTAKVEADFLPLPAVFTELKTGLNVGSLDKEDEQAKVNYAVTLEGNDPYMIADVLNDLVTSFVSVYTGTTEGQDVNVLSQMEKDLNTARDRDEKARDDLAQFYANHPLLLSAQDGDGYALVTAQADKNQLEDRVQNLQQLQNRKPAADAANSVKRAWLSDAVFMLSSYGVLQVNSIQTRLQEADAKRNELSTTLPPTHPRILALDAEIASLQPELEQLLDVTFKNWTQKLNDARNEVAAHLPKNIPITADLEAKRLTTEKEAAAKALEDLQTNYTRAKFSMGRDVFKVNVVDVARPPPYQAPNLMRRLLFSMVALLVGFFPGFLWIIFRQILFSRIYTREDAERKLKATVLGEVFFQKPLKGGGDPMDFSVWSHVENFRLVRSEIENYFFTSSSNQAFLVTSSKPGEGKSIFAANSAVSFARHGLRTLLVDADLRQGHLTKVFGTQRASGLTDLLREAGQDRESQKNRLLGAIVPAREKNLFFLPRGTQGLRAGESLSQGRMEDFIAMFRGEFDVVVVDTSPVLPVADALNLMRAIPNVVFLVRSGEISSSSAKETLERIKARGVRVGCVLNAIHESPFIKNQFSQYEDYYNANSGDVSAAPLPMAPPPPQPPAPMFGERQPNKNPAVPAREGKRPKVYLSPSSSSMEKLFR